MSHPCNNGEATCSHLCFPLGEQTYHCACPSYGGLTLAPDNTTCRGEAQITLLWRHTTPHITSNLTVSRACPDQHKKTSELHVTCHFCGVDSPYKEPVMSIRYPYYMPFVTGGHKGPVMRKAFPCLDVIIAIHCGSIVTRSSCLSNTQNIQIQHVSAMGGGGGGGGC